MESNLFQQVSKCLYLLLSWIISRIFRVRYLFANQLPFVNALFYGWSSSLQCSFFATCSFGPIPWLLVLQSRHVSEIACAAHRDLSCHDRSELVFAGMYGTTGRHPLDYSFSFKLDCTPNQNGTLDQSHIAAYQGLAQFIVGCYGNPLATTNFRGRSGFIELGCLLQFKDVLIIGFLKLS